MLEIKYLGQVINKNGCRLALTDTATLQLFRGMVNYYNPYVPRMHDLKSLLNKLLNGFG